MASEVDISNLALSRLGDDATVSSLDPPEGSTQAEQCATFYPIARDSLLELHNWKFATRRIALAPVDLPDNAGWGYAYAEPADCIQVISVIPPSAPGNYSAQLGNLPVYSAVNDFTNTESNAFSKTFYMPQDFQIETNEEGNNVILTDQPDASARFIKRVIDTTRFSPLFVDALGWYLASMLAGPLLKGDVGAAEAKRCLQLAMGLLPKATTSDARQQQVKPQQNVPWLGVR